MIDRIWGESIECEETSIIHRDEEKTLETKKNRIYFYSEIEREKVLLLNSRLKEMDNSHLMLYQILELNSLCPIFIHINSYGGSIFHALSAMDNILNCKSDVITIVDGIVASAATFLSLVGTKRKMTRHSFMLIHQLRAWHSGTYETFEDNKQNLDLFMKTIKKIYKKYTKLPMKKLDEILKRDLFLDAETCLEYGLIDEII